MGYRIALVIPYFGKFNNYFPLWLTSCRCNPGVDWLIFTDDKTAYDYPSNVRVTYTTFDEIKAKIQNRFDFKISLDNPYKLCDFKATYGDVFSDELRSYDFWGHCDVDLIWGNIRRFYTDEILSSYDKISDAGHFTLYPNTEEMRTAYRTFDAGDCLDWREVYSSPLSFAFDEWGQNRGINRILLNNGKKIFYKPIFFSDIQSNKYGLYNNRYMYDLSGRAEFEAEKTHIVFKLYKGTLEQYALDKNGQVVCGEEAYVHFQKRPMKVEVTEPYSDKFLVYPPNRFIDCPDKIDAEYLKSVDENHINWHYYRVRLDNLVRKVKRLYGRD